MSTVVIFREMVFSSASRYRSMKYSWSKKFKGTVQRDGSGPNYVHSKGLRRFLEKSARLNLQRHLAQLLAIGILIASSAHSSICGLLFVTDNCCDGAMNKFGICFH
jgi:hypothetical protein